MKLVFVFGFVVILANLAESLPTSISIRKSHMMSESDLKCFEGYLKWTGFIESDVKEEPNQECKNKIDEFLNKEKASIAKDFDDKDLTETFDEVKNGFIELNIVEHKMAERANTLEKLANKSLEYSEFDEDAAYKKLHDEARQIRDNLKMKFSPAEAKAMKYENIFEENLVSKKLSKFAKNDKDDFCLRKFTIEHIPITLEGFKLEENPKNLNVSSFECVEKMKTIKKAFEDDALEYYMEMTNSQEQRDCMQLEVLVDELFKIEMAVIYLSPLASNDHLKNQVFHYAVETLTKCSEKMAKCTVIKSVHNHNEI